MAGHTQSNRSTCRALSKQSEKQKSITHFHLYVLKNTGTPNIVCNHELHIQNRKVVFAWKENRARDAEIQKMINERKK